VNTNPSLEELQKQTQQLKSEHAFLLSMVNSIQVQTHSLKTTIQLFIRKQKQKGTP
jgi:hypothetical protein